MTKITSNRIIKESMSKRSILKSMKKRHHSSEATKPPRKKSNRSIMALEQLDCQEAQASEAS
jgi:hypothetical protein